MTSLHVLENLIREPHQSCLPPATRARKRSNPGTSYCHPRALHIPVSTHFCTANLNSEYVIYSQLCLRRARMGNSTATTLRRAYSGGGCQTAKVACDTAGVFDITQQEGSVRTVCARGGWARPQPTRGREARLGIELANRRPDGPLGGSSALEVASSSDKQHSRRQFHRLERWKCLMPHEDAGPQARVKHPHDYLEEQPEDEVGKGWCLGPRCRRRV